jgi:hypothetical protein
MWYFTTIIPDTLEAEVAGLHSEFKPGQKCEIVCTHICKWKNDTC